MCPVPKLSEHDKAKLLDRSQRAAKQADRLKRLEPTWNDYVREGVLDLVPEPDANGKIDVQVQGRERVVKLLKMRRERVNAESDYFDEAHASIPKVKIRRGREVVEVPERQAEQRERKHFVPRTSIVVPALPWQEKK